ncbi:MAG TPA: trypsin-like peptidase domain-containing protein [Kiritimatiellia bacterium]|nr:trypsin-like peptidase domain-containing protein [Kiritimatiellia bacterium]HPS08596.1 trypsin-like peptidase domain-containing protein [Kiritimatiellia bacterium]
MTSINVAGRKMFAGIVAENDHLFRDPNVLSIGIGYKHTRGEESRRLALVVAVRKKIRNQKTIPAGYRIARKVKAGRSSPGGRPLFLPTDVIEQKPKRFSAAAAAVSGAAIQVVGGLTWGTLGGFVRSQNGEDYALTCSHVATDFGRVTRLGAPVTCAGDGAVFGRLARYSLLIPGVENWADVALVRVTSQGCLSRLATAQPAICGLGGPCQVNDPVAIIGAASGKRTGTVTRFAVKECVFGWGGSPGACCYLAGQIEVSDVGRAGDSGAVAVDARGRAVGLFVADNGVRDLMTPVDRALLFASKPAAMCCAADDTARLELSFV